MTAKQKAEELIEKFYPHVQWKLGQEDCLIRAKQCALIAADEVLGYMGADRGTEFWVEVKNEIEKL